MEPLTISLLLGLVGAGTKMFGDYQENEAKQKELAANKQLAEQAAADALARGNQDAGRARMQGSQLIERQKVGYAASGVDATAGTPLQVMAGTRLMSELDARTLENNAAREAWGYKQHGLAYQQQAALERQRYGNRQAGTVLGGIGQAIATWPAKGG